jgi:hypothetical protein
VRTTVRRDHIVDLIIGDQRPFAVHLNFVVVANHATLGRPTIHQIAARTLAIVSFELRVETLMPFIVAYPIVSFLRRRVYTRNKETALPSRVMQYLLGMYSGRDARFIARPPPRTVRAAFAHTACMRLSLSRVHRALFVPLLHSFVRPRRKHSSVPTDITIAAARSEGQGRRFFSAAEDLCLTNASTEAGCP